MEAAQQRSTSPRARRYQKRGRGQTGARSWVGGRGFGAGGGARPPRAPHFGANCSELGIGFVDVSAADVRCVRCHWLPPLEAPPPRRPACRTSGGGGLWGVAGCGSLVGAGFFFLSLFLSHLLFPLSAAGYRSLLSRSA